MLEIVSNIQGWLEATMIGTYLADIAFSSLRKHDELARCNMREPYADAALTIMLCRAVKLSRNSLKLLHKHLSLSLPQVLVWRSVGQNNT